MKSTLLELKLWPRSLFWKGTPWDPKVSFLASPLHENKTKPCGTHGRIKMNWMPNTHDNKTGGKLTFKDMPQNFAQILQVLPCQFSLMSPLKTSISFAWLYRCFRWYATLENKTPTEVFPKFPSVLRVVDRLDRNPPIAATSVTF